MPPEITITGMEELQRRLEHQYMFKEAIRIFASRAVRTGKRTATKAIDGGTGLAAQSIVAQFDPANGIIFTKTMIPLARGLSIERGRRPGDPPSLGALIRWKEAVGHPLSARQLRPAISRQGVRGKAFIGQVEDQWRASIPRWLEEAAVRVEKRWKKA